MKYCEQATSMMPELYESENSMNWRAKQPCEDLAEFRVWIGIGRMVCYRDLCESHLNWIKYDHPTFDHYDRIVGLN